MTFTSWLSFYCNLNYDRIMYKTKIVFFNFRKLYFYGVMYGRYVGDQTFPKLIGWHVSLLTRAKVWNKTLLEIYGKMLALYVCDKKCALYDVITSHWATCKKNLFHMTFLGTIWLPYSCYFYRDIYFIFVNKLIFIINSKISTSHIK